jgi:predicted Zn-dependent protease
MMPRVKFATDPLEDVARRFRDAAPQVDFWSLRVVSEANEVVSVRRNVVQPVTASRDFGVMVTVHDGGGTGYGATCDVSAAGLRQAAERAAEWARLSAAAGLVGVRHLPRDAVSGEYRSRVETSWESVPLRDKIDLVRAECERLKSDDRIVDWDASLWHTAADHLFTTSTGTHIRQRLAFLVPMMSATANAGAESQTRTFGGHAQCRQGGIEVLRRVGFHDAAPRIAAEALQLLLAPDCPRGRMDLLLAPDQVILQVHESIGHPLELDRILGDERNYAGTSFVTLDMFGTYRYGSDLLNVVFDPTQPEQLASYGFDDEGEPARREDIIRNGILVRALGGVSSQRRAGVPGVANARATSWNRPPIDRIANLNLEPGASRFADMVAAVERGVYMATNCSWSIDDSRDKFQFGCEWAQRIEGGRLTSVVRKPNYRGRSATFWRSLKMVGAADTLAVLGSPFCGKGEPNQVIRVGHAAPACLFENVEVFGGAE